MNSWYQEYWAQTWYKNTFLVNHPNQIGKVISDDKEWNNIEQSGCNFTCLAMIIGIDPAQLASLLSTKDVFQTDKNLQAKHLNGTKSRLVWDQNYPYKKSQILRLNNIWHPQLKSRVSITVSFHGIKATKEYSEGKLIVSEYQSRGSHIICGTDEHSHLVAGENDNDYFLWDPDDSEMESSVERNLSGEITLKNLFITHKGKDIEFWEYRLEKSP